MIKTFPTFIFVDDNSLRRISVPNVIRSEMETGPQKTRPIQTDGFFNVAMSVSICTDKLTEFRSWFKSIKSGADWFLMRDPFDGTTRRFRFVEYENEWQKRGNLLTNSFMLEAYDEL